jgi:transcriptional regulator with XRE-family HTH domain
MVKKSTKTAESMALRAAFDGAKVTQAAVATHMSVTPGAFRQWLFGQRPVPVAKAARLAKYLGTDAAQICAKYAELAEQNTGSNVVPIRRADDTADQRRPDLAMRRVENDVDSLRFALSAIVAATVIHRPAEALAVAAALRREVPEKFRERGFVHELLVTLDAAARVKG